MPALPTIKEMWYDLSLDTQLDILEEHTLFRRETFDKYRYTKARIEILNNFALFLVYLEPIRKRRDGKKKFVAPELPIIEVEKVKEIIEGIDE